MAGTSNESGVADDCNFGDLSGYFFGNFKKIRPAILYGDMLPFVGL